MIQNQIETHLVRKQSKFSAVCNYCNNPISSDDISYVEEGVTEHIHSLIARKFCSDCYTKYGEQILLKGKNE
ncbi:MAG: hypothetical protein KAJ69_05720 [Thermoplasmatales archaeon]|nr:hypothetical protein [Thermoplasmatales archaeon]